MASSRSGASAAPGSSRRALWQVHKPWDHAACGELLTDFAQHKDIAGTVYNLAKHYNSLNNPEMARRLHDYNVEHYADDVQGMYSQVEIVKSHLASGDDQAVDAACNRLVTTFAQQKGLPKEVYQIGLAYSQAGRAERAGVFYRYVLDHWPQSPHAAWAQLAVLDDQGRAESDPAVRAALNKLLESLPQQDLSARDLYRAARDLSRSKPKRALALHRHNGRNSAEDDQYSLWSATELTKAYIRDGNEPAAEQAVNEMTARFAEQETLSTELARIGDTYLEVGQRDKADQLYTYIGNNWADKDDTLWARVGRVRLHITNGDDDAAEATFQKVLADYAENVSLPDAVRHVGESYYNEALAIQKRLNQERRADSNQPAAEVPMPARVNDCFQKASVKFEGLIQKWPNDGANTPFAYHFAGECYERLGQREKAIAYYQKVCDTWPDYQYSWHLQFLVGRACEAQMKANPADSAQLTPLVIAAYERVLKDHPTCPAARAAASRLQRYAALREGE